MPNNFGENSTSNPVAVVLVRYTQTPIDQIGPFVILGLYISGQERRVLYQPQIPCPDPRRRSWVRGREQRDLDGGHCAVKLKV